MGSSPAKRPWNRSAATLMAAASAARSSSAAGLFRAVVVRREQRQRNPEQVTRVRVAASIARVAMRFRIGRSVRWSRGSRAGSSYLIGGVETVAVAAQRGDLGRRGWVGTVLGSCSGEFLRSVAMCTSRVFVEPNQFSSHTSAMRFRVIAKSGSAASLASRSNFRPRREIGCSANVHVRAAGFTTNSPMTWDSAGAAGTGPRRRWARMRASNSR